MPPRSCLAQGSSLRADILEGWSYRRLGNLCSLEAHVELGCNRGKPAPRAPARLSTWRGLGHCTFLAKVKLHGVTLGKAANASALGCAAELSRPMGSCTSRLRSFLASWRNSAQGCCGPALGWSDWVAVWRPWQFAWPSERSMHNIVGRAWPGATPWVPNRSGAMRISLEGGAMRGRSPLRSVYVVGHCGLPLL